METQMRKIISENPLVLISSMHWMLDMDSINFLKIYTKLAVTL